MRKLHRLLTILGTFGVVFLLAMSSSNAATRTLTLTPHAKVKNHGTIAVVGKGGWPAGTTYIVECADKAGKKCDTKNVVIASPKKGTFKAKIKVHEGAVGKGVCKAHKTCYIIAANVKAKAVVAKAFTFK